MDTLEFKVSLDEEGNYCAEATVPEGVLLTDARDVDQLLRMVREVVALYAEDEGIEVEAFSLRFPADRAA